MEPSRDMAFVVLSALSLVLLSPLQAQESYPKTYERGGITYTERQDNRGRIHMEYESQGVGYTAVFANEQKRQHLKFEYVEFQDSSNRPMRYVPGAGSEFLDLHLVDAATAGREFRQIAAIHESTGQSTQQENYLELARANKVRSGLHIPIIDVPDPSLESMTPSMKARDLHLAIHEAAKRLHFEALEFLLNSDKAKASSGRASADVVLYSDHHWPLPPLKSTTPLHKALRARPDNREMDYLRLRVVNLLLEHGADPNRIDGFSKNPLQIVLLSRLPGEQQIKLVESLLEKGADPNLLDEASRNSKPGLVLILESKVLSSEEKEKLILRFLKSGADPDLKGVFGSSATPSARELAASKGFNLEKLLLQVGDSKPRYIPEDKLRKNSSSPGHQSDKLRK